MKISAFISGLAGLLLACGPASAQQYLTTTIAGASGATGYSGDGGPASAAQFFNPLCVAVDSKGNYYIADSKNYVIRMVAAGTGIINSIAGNGTIGFSGDGGPATSAQISTVEGLAVDSAGNVYIADTGNARIRVVTAANGNISTLAGNGTRGALGDHGPAANAELFLPAGLAIDGQGNLYVADYGVGSVRKISPSGIIANAAGIEAVGFAVFPGEGGLATSATLGMPYSVAVDESGNLFVGDIGTSSIRKVTTDGKIHTFVPQVSTASLATDPAGNLYYGDYRQNVIVKVYPNGAAQTIAGGFAPGYLGDYGPGILAQFDEPYGIAIDSSANIYVADYTNNVVRFLQPQPSSSVIVTNGADNLEGLVAPGEIVSLFGMGLGPVTSAQAQPDANGLIESQLAGTTVTFNGIPAPVLSTQSLQVVAAAPYALTGATQATVVVSYQGQPLASAAVSVVATAPQIFTSLSTGCTTCAAQNADGTVNTTGNAAAESSTITVFVAGVGQTSPPGVDGKIATGPAFPALPLSATVNGLTATATAVTSSGLTDEITQVNVTLPSGVTTSSAVPVVIQIGNATSLPVNIAVK